jgi:hypothetical protein
LLLLFVFNGSSAISEPKVVDRIRRVGNTLCLKVFSYVILSDHLHMVLIIKRNKARKLNIYLGGYTLKPLIKPLFVVEYSPRGDTILNINMQFINADFHHV